MQKNKQQQFEVRATFTVPFTQVSNDVIDCSGFDNPIDKLVYISLLRFAFHKGSAYPSVKTLAKMNNSSENRIRQSLKRLEELGLITIEPRIENNVHNTNLYHLHDLPEELKRQSIFNEESSNKGDTSKNEVPQKMKDPTSKNEAPLPQKMKDPTSNFEEEEEVFNNKNINNKKYNKNLSISEGKIQQLDLPIAVQKQLILKKDRLIEDAINLEEIELVFKAYCDTINDYQFAQVLANVLESTQGKIINISKLLQASITNFLNQKNITEQRQVESYSTEVVPDWFKERKMKQQMKKQQEYDFSKRKMI